MRLRFSTGPAVDLNAPGITHEDHDRDRIVAHRLEHARQARRCHRARKLRAGQTQGLKPSDSQAAQHAEEFVGILERRPFTPQPLDIDLGVGAISGRRIDRAHIQHRRLIVRAPALDQPVEGRRIRWRLLVDLMNRHAVGIEDLQRAARSLRCVIDHGKGVMPARRKQSQVDQLPEHQSVRAVDRDIQVRADFLVYAMLVAGQRHHRTQGRHVLHDGCAIRPQARRGAHPPSWR